MTRAEPEIRSFFPADWDAICAVYASAAKAELAVSGIGLQAFRPMSDEEDLDTFVRLNTTLVAVVDGHVVGFVAWRGRGEWVDSGYLSWLYVDPAHHRRGIGSALLSRAMEALGRQAWTLVKQGNDPAIHLYRKRGMEVVRSYPAETGGFHHTELRMALPTSQRSDPEVPNFGI